MKIRWKRINWGVLFALVLIAGLVIYLIVDNAKFKQSKSEIMETAERYLQEQPLAEKEGSGGSDALEELLNQYWAEIKLPGGINGQGKGAVLGASVMRVITSSMAALSSWPSLVSRSFTPMVVPVASSLDLL